MGKKYKGDKDRLYVVWIGMKGRCYNSKHPKYRIYGARGISVCDDWRYSYKKFQKWALDNGYNYHAEYGECTLDRIDNDGNYEPDNCRWVSIKTQSNNRRDNIVVTYNYETHTLSEWSEILGIEYRLVAQRYYKGMPAEKIFSNIVKKHNTIILEYGNEKHTLSEWEKITGINYDALKYRYYAGWSVKDILTKPLEKRKKKNI